jgi:hypothetical protein
MGKIVIKWVNSTEADLKSFIVYRDTVKDFKAEPGKKIAETTDPYYTGLPGSGSKLYYKITAIDKQGNESKPSEEIVFTITGVNEPKVTINEYVLYQNYPNPFNPATHIGYRLAEGGNVKLTIYNIKGEQVETLLNRYQEAGYHEMAFNGKVLSNSSSGSKQELASGIYLCRIEITGKGGIPQFSDVKKIIYLK